MHITWHGNSGIKIQAKEGEIAIDPPQKQPHTKIIKKSDIVLISDFDKDTIKETSITEARLTISHPGEYELGGIMVQGIDNPKKSDDGKVSHRSTVFQITAEDMTIAHLGDLTSKPSADIIDKLGVINVLILPVSESISPSMATKIMNEIEPHIVIPVSIAKDEQQQKELLEAFIKETGTEKPEILPKALIKKKTLDPEETKIMLLDV